MSESPAKAAPNNPGVGTVLALALQNEAGETETINLDLAEMLGDVLSAHGIGNVRQDDWVVTEHGLKLLPQLANVELGDYFRTMTTIEAASPSFSGIFEYQHSNSEESIEASIREGFELWCKVDLLVLHDALRIEAEDCMIMQMDIPAEDGHPAYARRIVLGPVANFAEQPTPPNEEHPFCNCCFFTNTIDTFMDEIKGQGVRMVRFYAARDQDGQAMADCRINGEDFDRGKEALVKYAEGWPQRGFEFRKQLILIQDTPPQSGLRA